MRDSRKGRRSRSGRAAALLVAAGWLLAASAAGELAPEPIGRSETLPGPPGAHWVVVTDLMLRRAALLDLDSGAFLGMLSTGYMSQAGVFPAARPEFYWPETHYSRGTRGERTDVVTVYATDTLAPVDEIVIPPRRAVNVLTSGNATLSDDDRFLAVFNMTPATSLTIVDTEERRVAADLPTPGCALVFAAGARRFVSLCGDGGWLAVELDEHGAERARARGAPFFDPQTDPVTEKAVRWGDRWLFVSFEGRVHPLDVSGEWPQPGEAWSLVDERERAEGWRVGGMQHLAIHQASGRLYSLMHRGGPDSHKEPGSEVWVYDLASRQRVQRLELSHPGFSFLSETIEIGSGWSPPFDRLWGWVLDHLVPSPGLDQLQVTQDAEPLLVTGSQIGGSLAVYDARTLELLRRVPSGNLTIHVVHAPWGRRP